jgi:hypothetical protein
MKHDRYMDNGWEWKKARSFTHNASKVTLTRWWRSKGKCSVFCGLQNLNLWLKCDMSTITCLTKNHMKNCICHSDRQIKDMGNLLDKQCSGRPSVSDKSVENIWNSFICSPKKSACKCAQELGLSKTTANRVLEECSRFTSVVTCNLPRQ